MTQIINFESTYRAIQYSQTEDEVLVQLASVNSMLSKSEMSHRDANILKVQAFEQLKKLTIDNASSATELIKRLLLPICTDRSEPESGEDRVVRHNCRELLVEWIDQYRDNERGLIRDTVLDSLKRILADTPNKAIIWTISQIGFRRPDIAESLWSLARERNDDVLLKPKWDKPG